MPEPVARRAGIRRFRAEDARDIRSLVAPELERSGYPSAPRAAIDALVDGTDADARALVAMDEDAVIAFIIHGMIAGSEGAARLQLIMTAPAFRRSGIARRLVESAIEDLRGAGARFVAVEMPLDPALEPAAALLGRCGFHIEARVRDFYRDGVDLAIFRRDIPRS